jgi:hypothetical protein
MTRAQTAPNVKKQLLAVADKLEDQRVTGPRRLALLRKQAELGDARDAAVDKARRARLDQER